MFIFTKIYIYFFLNFNLILNGHLITLLIIKYSDIIDFVCEYLKFFALCLIFIRINRIQNVTRVKIESLQNLSKILFLADFKLDFMSY